MNRTQVIERERRWQQRVGWIAVSLGPLYIISLALSQSSSVPLAGLETEQYRAIDEAGFALVGSVILRSLAFLLMTVPLLYLFRAAQARSERVSGPMVGFVFLGPVLLAAQGVIAHVAQVSVASDFVAQAGPGGDIYTLLDDLIDASTASDVALNLLFPGLLGLIVVMVYVPLQAQRVGLLSRFFATFGMALGASSLFIVPALSLLALMIWFGWLGFVILDKVPRGRPPAWDAGEAMPWPRGGEQPKPAVASDGVVDGDATEVFEEPSQPRDHSARRERAKKRKRKRRQ